MAALTTFKKKTTKSILTPECHNMLNRPLKKRAVKLLHFSEHNGINGNELTDVERSYTQIEKYCQLCEQKNNNMDRGKGLHISQGLDMRRTAQTVDSRTAAT